MMDCELSRELEAQSGRGVRLHRPPIAECQQDPKGGQRRLQHEVQQALINDINASNHFLFVSLGLVSHL